VEALCGESVLTLEALRAGVGLSLAQGADIPGFASTVGLGESGRPRISTSVRVAVTRLSRLVLIGSQQVPAEASTLSVASVQANVGLGVFNGFTGTGNLRGVFSLDLLGSAGLTFLPDGAGFHGAEFAYGYGARVGLLREGFSNPGVALSIMRREFRDDVVYGSTADAVQMAFDPETTSIRLSVGRDYFAAGFVVGGGVDWYDGEVSLTVREQDGGMGTAPGAATGAASSTDFTSRRATIFAGGQYTYKVFQLSTEFGWANGFDAMEGYTGPFDPGSSTYYGNLAVRLTF